MNLRRFAIYCLFLLLSFSLQSNSARAQDPPQQEPQSPGGEPKPAARSTFPTIDPGQSEENQDPNALQPDLTPLTGLEEATLGSPQFQRSYWVPGLQFASVVQQNSAYGSSSSDWYAYNHFLGNLTLLKEWSRSTLSVNCSAGAFFSSGNNSLNTNNRDFGWTSLLSIVQSYHTHRWVFDIFDRFSYLPTSQFGYGAGTNLGIPGVGGSLGSTGGLGGTYIPNQSIFATNGPILSNTGALQATYVLSRRSSMTAASAFGILRFVDPGNVDSNMFLASLGYNYAINQENEIGVIYRFTSSHYAGVPQAYGNHIVSAAYARKITGRLALQLYGGPQITTYRIPIGTDSHRINFAGSAHLNYALHNGSISAIYRHGFSGGSGVLVGSNLDQVNFTAGHQISRVWSGNVHFGYAHNASLSSSEPLNSSSYNSWFAGAVLNRPIGRHVYMGLAYQAYLSKRYSSGCVGSSCDSTFTVNTFNLSLQWHTRPFVLE